MLLFWFRRTTRFSGSCRTTRFSRFRRTTRFSGSCRTTRFSGFRWTTRFLGSVGQLGFFGSVGQLGFLGSIGQLGFQSTWTQRELHSRASELRVYSCFEMSRKFGGSGRLYRITGVLYSVVNRGARGENRLRYGPRRSHALVSEDRRLGVVNIQVAGCG